MLVRIRHLGLAAYIAMGGCKLVRVEGREFLFETDLTAAQWRVQYNNSCCMRHDTFVCELRHHLPGVT